MHCIQKHFDKQGNTTNDVKVNELFYIQSIKFITTQTNYRSVLKCLYHWVGIVDRNFQNGILMDKKLTVHITAVKYCLSTFQYQPPLS